MPDVSPHWKLMQLPCGCTVEAIAMTDYLNANGLPGEDSTLLCMWCQASFSVEEFKEWYYGEDHPLLLESSPKPLLRCGDKVLEALSRCPCGMLIVREHGRVSGMKRDVKFHLDVPADAVQLMRN